ncbi:MAG: flagellar hook-basal body complex protein [Candidatus Aquicultor sp.]|nr:flagellar hook-basal body complex protein [Candidatus Aquicultor sp.]
MIRGLYTSATGMLALMNKQDVISNNLANINTTGFKRDYASITSFPDALVYASEKSVGTQAAQTPIGWLSTGVGIGQTGFINTDAPLRHTGSMLDVALSGNGLFAVGTQAGERYTRNGSFGIDGLSRLVDQDGNLVLGENGAIAINGDEVFIDETGNIYVDDTFIDKLKIRHFEADELEKAGSNLFISQSEGKASEARVRQKYLEGSNVDVTIEMVDMITTVRSFEANQKILKSQDEILGRAVNDVGRLA